MGKQPNKTDRAKIIWAVDPFADEKHLQRSTACAIQAFTQRMVSEISPIYLYSGYLMDVPLEVPKDLIEEMRISAQKTLDLIVSGLKISNLRPLKILSQPYLPMKGGVHELIAYAEKEEAKVIATGTHMRKGLNRWAMGSFAENLTLYSTIPLLVVNPLWQPVHYFKQILFPTDFSNESKAAFDEVLKFARPMGCKITLFHKIKQGLVPRMQKNLRGISIYPSAVNQQLEICDQEARKWTDHAASQHVPVSVHIDSETEVSVVEMILSLAHKNHGLIALAAQSGPARTALWGSITRKVVRASLCPVWVLHAKKTQLFSISESEIMEDLQHPSSPRQTA